MGVPAPATVPLPTPEGRWVWGIVRRALYAMLHALDDYYGFEERIDRPRKLIPS